MRACQVLRPRRAALAIALALLDILPSATQTASAPGISFLSRLNGWPARSPADASPTSSRMPAHGSGRVDDLGMAQVNAGCDQMLHIEGGVVDQKLGAPDR